MKIVTKFDIGDSVQFRKDIPKQRTCAHCKGKDSKREDGYVCGKCSGEGKEYYNGYVIKKGTVTDVELNHSEEGTDIVYTVRIDCEGVYYILESELKLNNKKGGKDV